MDLNDLKEIKDLVDKYPPSFCGHGPLHPVVHNGVVHLCNENGSTIIMMNKHDYEKLVEYKSSK